MRDLLAENLQLCRELDQEQLRSKMDCEASDAEITRLLEIIYCQYDEIGRLSQKSTSLFNVVLQWCKRILGDCNG